MDVFLNLKILFIVGFFYFCQAMGFIVLFCSILVITYLVYKYSKCNGLSKNDILIGWVVKLFFGGLYLYIFINYYGNGNLYGDSSGFFRDSKLISQLAIKDPYEYLKLLFGLTDITSPVVWEHLKETNLWFYNGSGDFINDNRLILKVNSVIHLFSFNNLYVHSLIHVLISFIGIKLIFTTFSDYVKCKKLFWYALVCLPSLSFWSGALLKESLLVFGLGLLFFNLKKLRDLIRIKHLLFYFIGVLFITYNKPYTGLIVFPLSFLLLIGEYYSWSIVKLKIVSVFVLIIFIFLMFAPSRINLTEKVSVKQKDLMNMGKGGVFFITDSSFCFFDYKLNSNFEMISDSMIKVNVESKGEYKLFGKHNFKPFTIQKSDKLYPHYLSQIPSTSYFDTEPIDYSVVRLIKNIPLAVVDVHLRPFPWDNGDKLKWFAFLQNILLISLVLFSFYNKRILYNKDKWILFILISSSFFITLLIGWTTPIFGAIVRYKVPVDLFIIIISFILLKSKKHEKI